MIRELNRLNDAESQTLRFSTLFNFVKIFFFYFFYYYHDLYHPSVLGVMRPAAVAAVLAAALVDVTRASATILMILAVSEMVLVIAIAVASVTCRPYYGLGHQSRK